MKSRSSDKFLIVVVIHFIDKDIKSLIMSVTIALIKSSCQLSFYCKPEENKVLWTDPQVVFTTREYKRGKYHCTIDLLFDWFRLVCFANKNKNCQSSYSWFQTSQTGGQWYSDISPFSVPCHNASLFVTYDWAQSVSICL